MRSRPRALPCDELASSDSDAVPAAQGSAGKQPRHPVSIDDARIRRQGTAIHFRQFGRDMRSGDDVLRQRHAHGDLDQAAEHVGILACGCEKPGHGRVQRRTGRPSARRSSRRSEHGRRRSGCDRTGRPGVRSRRRIPAKIRRGRQCAGERPGSASRTVTSWPSRPSMVAAHNPITPPPQISILLTRPPYPGGTAPH